ncbi:hypothetical protein AB1Y20_023009 [Prymnesium parvum]|uniref:Uncharacterized protein n=1 Tax=Prymnesium parvum TaxID=97485 RepID=A0AB34JD54_PRYPA
MLTARGALLPAHQTIVQSTGEPLSLMNTKSVRDHIFDLLSCSSIVVGGARSAPAHAGLQGEDSPLA